MGVIGSTYSGFNGCLTGNSAISGTDYGSFYDTSTQLITGINVPNLMELNATAQANGISVQNNNLGKPTRITVTNSGVYNLQFSAQLYRSSGGTRENIVIWFRKNGQDIPYSATDVTLQANAQYLVAAWNFVLSLQAGQYVAVSYTHLRAHET